MPQTAGDLLAIPWPELRLRNPQPVQQNIRDVDSAFARAKPVEIGNVGASLRFFDPRCNQIVAGPTFVTLFLFRPGQRFLFRSQPPRMACPIGRDGLAPYR